MNNPNTLRLLTIAKSLVEKSGARHSSKDTNMVQQMHDLACELGAKCDVKKATGDFFSKPAMKADVADALVLRHPGHGNQKAHGNRFGSGQAKESLRRLKDDKEAREKYKDTHRKKQGYGSKLDKQIADQADREKQRETELKTTVRQGSEVEFYGHTSGMAESLGKPKVKMTGRVTHLDKDEDGNQIARIEFVDSKGNSKNRWFHTTRDTWRHTNQKEWNKPK